MPLSPWQTAVEEYGPCYHALLHYRLGRRLLEQVHAPWLWDDWGPACASDDSASSASSGAGAPAPQCAPASLPLPVESAALEEPEQRARAAPEEERGAEAAGDAEDSALPALPVKDIKEKPERQIRTREPDKLPSSTEPQQPPSALPARGSRRAVKSPQRSSTKIKEHKHPFALYGWGEKQTDTGSQKTHNVCASASVHEIHESALRAKSRRQVEKRRLAAQRQRAHSADVDRTRRVKPASSENPWMTEYMRCYSARA
ncbi:centriole, cilia and spindle-associated protein-like [Balaenoptera acutorostrata]|uniref:Centriole, cilia and spindle-associated protein-like n=1 Tax=Balaenoptera acutorostrata TaxID=9767 RepID=A0ABM3TER3_BALAC|nr:centriole, cilia and spindle-associated protein-like [Balaenoptera acutorostrata]